jgi:hypothetical protein
MEMKIDMLSGDLAPVRTKAYLVVTSISLVQQEQVHVANILKSGAACSATPTAADVMGAVPSDTSAGANPLVFNTGLAIDREPVHEQEELALGPSALRTAHNLDLGSFLLKLACGAMITGEVNTDAHAFEFTKRATRVLEHRSKGGELELAMSLHIAAVTRCGRGRHDDAIPAFDNLHL